MNEWYSIAGILDLNDAALPQTKRGLLGFVTDRNWDLDKNRSREVAGKGGVRKEYHYSVFPELLQARLIHNAILDEVAAKAEPSRVEIQREAFWATYAQAAQPAKDEAAQRMSCLQQVDMLLSQGTLHNAITLVAHTQKVSYRTLYRWYELISDVEKTDWLAALLPVRKGRTSKSECDRRAWDHLVSNYLRPAELSYQACFDLMQEAALEHNWSPVPSAKTMKRRIEKEIGRAAIIMARKGERAAASLYPSQTRDHSVFHAMEAVNSDGHVFDVFVKWPDGRIGRPILVGYGDIYSGFVLSHRIGQTENKELVRLATADMIESWGIPEHAYFDNGRAFMNKCLTGRMQFRFRFKVRDEDPQGILENLNVKVHAVTPHHGQAKPIERTWKDMADRISKHPAFDGAYTGNKPHAKPADYNTRAIPIDEFEKVVAQEIIRHNNQQGRRGQNANGRSLAETFKASLEQSTTLVRKATEFQRQLFLMAGECKKSHKSNGEIHLDGNRYWSERLVNHAGEKLIIRFDPENLHDDLHVYTLENRYIDRAPCIEATGFRDTEAARTHAKNKRNFTKACREMVKLSKLLTPAQVAAQIPDPEPMDMPQQKVVGLFTPSGGAQQIQKQEAEDAFGRGMAEVFEVTELKRRGD